jgi:Zn-dependent M28 family amino/carboxypeptidase
MKLALLFAAGLCFADSVSPEAQAVLDRITANELRGDLSFLSSDLLEGRDTPSRGLDLAAEFIAAEFRRAGLEPVFQVAEYLQITPDMNDFSVTVDGAPLPEKADVQAVAAIDINDAPAYVVENAKPPSLEGKVAVIAIPDFRAQGARENIATYRQWLAAAKAQHPAAILQYYEGTPPRRGGGNRLVEAAEAKAGPPVLTIGEAGAKVTAKSKISIHMKMPTVKTVQVRNVAALLKGSDPQLANTYILVTAHYDHLGVKVEGEGDRIYNGANDDGSGTVTVIELAGAMAASKTHPKRSILFMTFFGEEKGLFGSRYYAAHPLYPLKDTIAQVNLEQLGRTDDKEGPQVGTATFTGFDFSDLPAAFSKAGEATGVKIYNSEKNGDAFFSRSDNQSLADAGVPAHTLAVAFDFPDYHAVGDEWKKIDYDNMVKVDRMIALGLLDLANRAAPPHWNESNPKAEKYLNAWKALHK